MSRTWKDRKDFKKRRKHRSYTVPRVDDRIRGGYDDYDHSCDEMYVYDQCCENCRYQYNCNHKPFPSGWCEFWKGDRR